LIASAAILALGAGCGDEPSASLVTPTESSGTPSLVSAVDVGDIVSPGPATPGPVVRALAGDEVLVVGFLIDGVADDARVAEALETVKDSKPSAKVLVYGAGRSQGIGDLADLLGVSGTPTVAVIDSDGVLRNRFTGLVDADILRQSVADAEDAALAGTSGDDGTG
jgi:hypothetical protein